MSTQQLDPDKFRLFEWRDDLDPEQFIFVDYYIESVFEPRAAAFSMAQEQSLTATAQEVLKRDLDFSPAAARVYAVEATDTGDGPLLPFYLLNEPFDADPHTGADGPFHRATVTLAYPVRNLGTGVTDLWNCVYGELPRHGILNAFRILNVRMPASFLSRFPGPAFGVRGLRRAFGVEGRPFLCRSMQPAVGLNTEQMLEINQAVLRGGFDIVKDDELSYDSELSPIGDRMERNAELARALSSETGEPKRYIANVIASPLRSVALLSKAESVGAHGVLVAPALQGIEFITDVRARTRLPIMAHNTGDDTATRSPRLGVHPALLIKLYRLSGADIVMLPGSTATRWQDDAEIKRCIEACSAPIEGIEPALPVLAGGKTPDSLATCRNLVGSADFMLIAATALNAHPDGLQHGAAAFRQAWEALQAERELRPQRGGRNLR